MPDVPYPHGHDGRTPPVPDDVFTAATLPPGPAEQAGPGASSSPLTGVPVLDAALDKAVSIPSAAVRAHVERLRRRNPEASPAQIIALLEKQYLMAVSTSGGAVGAAAAAPAIGTGVGIALTSAEVATFFGASSAFALAVADVHGIGVEETARRRTLLMATVLGEQGSTAISGEVGLNGGWARTLLVNMPTTTIKRVNARLARRFLRRQAAKQGALAFGRLAPFGIGAVIGATGARALGRTVVGSARQAFGPPPERFPRIIEVAASDAPAPAITDGRGVRLVETDRTDPAASWTAPGDTGRR
ncbi:hypothetical protein N866_17945 [Actinotalea ferrariae CF5-4]|uniref:Di-and tripeptidase n=1 Tax=Actinotalea ferrariae CF5-4 TaxID=948458 RepID=A0A021VV08_9CELL|nr:hypothetical protein [Actinotalea ferrariae]EYR65039.1 hypothetical protein N866_17945 [Actinotalea ferrariae CF5-4]